MNVHLGFNQEDSIVMNRASLERGMFRTEHTRSYKAKVDNNESSDTRRKFEDIVSFGKIQSKFGRVDNLDDDVSPFIGANLHSGDIIIGRCAESGADHSVKLKHTERGMVQKVVLSANDDEFFFAVISLRQVTCALRAIIDGIWNLLFIFCMLCVHICRFVQHVSVTSFHRCTGKRVSWVIWSHRRTFLSLNKG